MADYTSEMKALEELIKQEEANEASERTGVTQGKQIANMMTPITKRSPGVADILLGVTPPDRSKEMEQAWTGGGQARLTDIAENKKRLLEQYKQLKESKIKGDELALKESKLTQDQINKNRELALKEKELGLKRQELAVKGTTEKKPTEGQGVAGGFALRMEQAENDLNNLLTGKGYDPTSTASYAQDFYLYPELLKSDDKKLYEQIVKNFVSANLRKESGAAISPAEYKAETQKYFPQPGDGPEVIAQKKRSRDIALQTMKANAGKAYENIKSTIPSETLAYTPPKQISPKPGLMNEAVANTSKIDYSKLTDDQLAKIYSERIGGR